VAGRVQRFKRVQQKWFGVSCNGRLRVGVICPTETVSD